jgi:hypothetical protein
MLCCYMPVTKVCAARPVLQADSKAVCSVTTAAALIVQVALTTLEGLSGQTGG